MTSNRSMIQAIDILALSASAAEMLKARVARQVQQTGEVAGWHGRFTPGRIGAPGSAVPLRFLREYGGLDSKTESQVIQAILNAQHATGEHDGGWHILSVSTTPSVEGTALTLECLIGSSGPGVREAINRGQTWLEKTCSPGGGWGSTPGNPPRVSITCASLLALAKMAAPDSGTIDSSTQWLVNTQRANGSWGPTPDEPSTLTHTAMALRALVAAGLPAEHPCINRAFKYIQNHWIPEPTAVQQESYDFHVGYAYDEDSEDVAASMLELAAQVSQAWGAVAVQARTRPETFSQVLARQGAILSVDEAAIPADDIRGTGDQLAVKALHRLGQYHPTLKTPSLAP